MATSANRPGSRSSQRWSVKRPEAGSTTQSNCRRSHHQSSIGATADSADTLLRTLRADLDSDAILKAELLVPGEVPFGLVTLIGVANDRVRDAVKPILAAANHKPKVAVYPPWFHPTEED